jgi:hypothetical protein
LRYGLSSPDEAGDSRKKLKEKRRRRMMKKNMAGMALLGFALIAGVGTSVWARDINQIGSNRGALVFEVRNEHRLLRNVRLLENRRSVRLVRSEDNGRVVASRSNDVADRLRVDTRPDAELGVASSRTIERRDEVALEARSGEMIAASDRGGEYAGHPFNKHGHGDDHINKARRSACPT